MATRDARNAARWKETETWPEGHRLCRGCKAMKVLEDFGVKEDSVRGRSPQCKVCCSLKSQREYAASSLEYRIWYRAKRRAKESGLPFDIEQADIVIPENCPVLGIFMVAGDYEHTPSIDRFIPALGYVKGNIRIISNRANRLKNDATIDELRKVIAYMEGKV